MPDARHLLHKEKPYVRSKEEALAYLSATFPTAAKKDVIRAGDTDTNPAPDIELASGHVVKKLSIPGVFVGVGGAFGAGPTWDHAIVHLMSDYMIGAYTE